MNIHTLVQLSTKSLPNMFLIFVTLLLMTDHCNIYTHISTFDLSLQEAEEGQRLKKKILFLQYALLKWGFVKFVLETLK